MSIISDIWGNPRIIVLFVISLIVPSATVVYILTGGEILKSAGHETIGSLITGLVTFFGDVTGAIGQAILPFAIWAFIIICFAKAVVEAVKS